MIGVFKVKVRKIIFLKNLVKITARGIPQNSFILRDVFEVMHANFN